MSKELERGEVYEGPCGVLKDSAWFNSESIPSDRDTHIQIRDVVRRKEVKFKDDTKKGYGSLRFVGHDKELGLNATHMHVLAALFGNECRGWFGKWIALYVDPDVKAFGKTVSAVRIRAKRIDGPAAPESAQPAPKAADRPKGAPMEERQNKRMHALASELGKDHDWLTALCIELLSVRQSQLSAAQAERLIGYLDLTVGGAFVETSEPFRTAYEKLESK